MLSKDGKAKNDKHTTGCCDFAKLLEVVTSTLNDCAYGLNIPQ